MQKHNSKYNFNILGGNGDKNQGSHSMCGSTALTVPFNFSFCDLLISRELEDIIGTNFYSVTRPKNLEGWGPGQFGKCPKKAAPSHTGVFPTKNWTNLAWVNFFWHPTVDNKSR